MAADPNRPVHPPRPQPDPPMAAAPPGAAAAAPAAEAAAAPLTFSRVGVLPAPAPSQQGAAAQLLPRVLRLPLALAVCRRAVGLSSVARLAGFPAARGWSVDIGLSVRGSEIHFGTPAAVATR